MKNAVVTHHNYINESKFENFTELELNLFIVILYKMRKEKENEVIFNSDEIKGLTSSKHRGYKTFTTIIEGLQDRTIYLKTSKGYDRIKPFPTLSFDIDNKEVRVEINKNIVPLIKELNQQFTQYSLREFLSLNSKYGKRIYQMLKQYENIGKRTINLSDLREYLDCTNKSYDKMSNLDKKVLFKAKEDINLNTSLKIDYKKNKLGRSIKSIEFYIVENNKDTFSHKIEATNGKAEYTEIIEEKNLKFNRKRTEKQGSRSKEDTFSHKDNFVSVKLKNGILNAKRNIFVSRAWNKRADNKIQKLVDEYGEEYALDILKRLYEGVKYEIKTTVVQYINGIMKNVKPEIKEKKDKQKKSTKFDITNSQETDMVEDSLAQQRNELISIEEFNMLSNEKKKELEEIAIRLVSEKESVTEKSLMNLKKRSFSIYFNTIKKYIKRP
ncbi:replication initiation protein [uncultured Ilyobacter sp.]|uniref:replication initiation protein n=1 Tax=uncultured Ilyobacter sp. TaxID=544433 RepID=UPI0029C04D2B|nr:replication initiation protein [uncultured Ilyobacter sp.]